MKDDVARAVERRAQHLEVSSAIRWPQFYRGESHDNATQIIWDGAHGRDVRDTPPSSMIERLTLRRESLPGHGAPLPYDHAKYFFPGLVGQVAVQEFSSQQRHRTPLYASCGTRAG
jgi:hypothetical protein